MGGERELGGVEREGERGRGKVERGGMRGREKVEREGEGGGEEREGEDGMEKGIGALGREGKSISRLLIKESRHAS